MFISKTNGIYKRNHLLGMNIMEEIFEIRGCIEIFTNDIKIYTVYQYLFHTQQRITRQDTLGFPIVRGKSRSDMHDLLRDN